jgi:outer membrane murein-binding lipoprotein Lpp
MGRVPPLRVALRQMTARQPPEEPTRPIPRARPIATERTVARTAPEETLWAEVLDRLGSVRTGLVFVAVLALAALGVALWALLGGAGDPDREDASRVRVERLADRVDRLESQVGEAASEGGVAEIRDEQRALQRRVQALEATVEESRGAGQDVEQIGTVVEALQDSVEALEQRVEALEQQQP